MPLESFGGYVSLHATLRNGTMCSLLGCLQCTFQVHWAAHRAPKAMCMLGFLCAISQYIFHMICLVYWSPNIGDVLFVESWVLIHA